MGNSHQKFSTKLVRSKVPPRVLNDPKIPEKKRPIFREATADERFIFLMMKLCVEENNELLEEVLKSHPNIEKIKEELADKIELIRAIQFWIPSLGKNQVEKVRRAKLRKMGGYETLYIMESPKEKPKSKKKKQSRRQSQLVTQ